MDRICSWLTRRMRHFRSDSNLEDELALPSGIIASQRRLDVEENRLMRLLPDWEQSRLRSMQWIPRG